MAYDPNDEKDVEFLEAEKTKAVEEATKQLKAKNVQLLKEKKELQASGSDPKALEKLEAEVEQLSEKLSTAEKEVKDHAKAAAKATKGLEAESAFTRTLLVDNGLTDALTKAKVAPSLMPGAKALLQGKALVVTEGDKRVVKIGDKLLTEAVTEWSQSDEGKAYVTAASNDGGGANGGRATVSGTGKTATREVFNAMSHVERSTFSKEGGTLTD